MNKISLLRTERAREALNCLRLSKHDISNGIVLDFGCGLGDITNYISMNEIFTVGFDINERVFIDMNKNILSYFILADGITIPFRKNIFHTIILNDVLEHISYENGKNIFNHIHMLLDKEGKIYISVANKYQIREPHTLLFFITWVPRVLYDPIIKSIHNMESVYPYTIKQLCKLCELNGFTCDDYTWYYIMKKIYKLKYVRDRITRNIILLLKKIKISDNGIQNIARKFSVIVFICKKIDTI